MVLVYGYSAPHDHHLKGLAGIVRARVQFDCYSYILGEAIDIADNLLALLDGFSGTMGTKTVAWCSIDNEYNNATSPQDGGESWLYRRTQDYIIRFRE